MVEHQMLLYGKTMQESDKSDWALDLLLAGITSVKVCECVHYRQHITCSH